MNVSMQEVSDEQDTNLSQVESYRNQGYDEKKEFIYHETKYYSSSPNDSLERNDKESKILDTPERDDSCTNNTQANEENNSGMIRIPSITHTALSLVDDLGKGIENILNFFDEPMDLSILYDRVDVKEFKRLSPKEQHIVITEVRKIAHLNSCDTFGMSPPTSPTSLASSHSNYDKRFESTDKNHKRRERRKGVSFDYPLVSSMKQLPRLTKNEIKELFFTSEEIKEFEREELEEYEKAKGDDIGVEIVIATSDDVLSDHDECCQDMKHNSVSNENEICLDNEHQILFTCVSYPHDDFLTRQSIPSAGVEVVYESGVMNNTYDDCIKDHESCSNSSSCCSISVGNESCDPTDQIVRVQRAHSHYCLKTGAHPLGHVALDFLEMEIPDCDQQEFWIPVDLMSP